MLVITRSCMFCMNSIPGNFCCLWVFHVFPTVKSTKKTSAIFVLSLSKDQRDSRERECGHGERSTRVARTENNLRV